MAIGAFGILCFLHCSVCILLNLLAPTANRFAYRFSSKKRLENFVDAYQFCQHRDHTFDQSRLGNTRVWLHG